MPHVVNDPSTTTLSDHQGLRSVAIVPPLGKYLRDTWRYRDFAMSLATASARSNHIDTALGNLWQLLNPVLLTAVYYLIFGVVLDISRGMDNYIGFLVVGVFLFSFIRKSAVSGAKAVVNSRSLVQTIRFPRLVLPVASTLTELLIFLPSVLVILAVVVLTGESIDVAWLLLMPLFVLMLIFNIGIAVATSRFTVQFRDLEEVLPFVIRLWFYMSGVLYPASRFGDKLGGAWQTVFEANPANVYITIGRDALLDGSTSSLRLWTTGFAWAVVTVVVATVFFRRHELEYGDV
jgi:teichoic acid transport system permease protein